MPFDKKTVTTMILVIVSILSLNSMMVMARISFRSFTLNCQIHNTVNIFET